MRKQNNAAETKLSSILSISLNIAKWMNTIDLNGKEVNTSFQIPKNLENFDSMVKKRFNCLKSPPKKLPEIIKMNHLTFDEGIPNNLNHSISGRNSHLKSTQTPVNLNMKIPSRSGMIGYLLK